MATISLVEVDELLRAILNYAFVKEEEKREKQT
jgi:hypothetical protein